MYRFVSCSLLNNILFLHSSGLSKCEGNFANHKKSVTRKYTTKMPKTSTERSREYRARKRAAANNPAIQPSKSGPQPARESRETQKQLFKTSSLESNFVGTDYDGTIVKEEFQADDAELLTDIKPRIEQVYIACDDTLLNDPLSTDSHSIKSYDKNQRETLKTPMSPPLFHEKRKSMEHDCADIIVKEEFSLNDENDFKPSVEEIRRKTSIENQLRVIVKSEDAVQLRTEQEERWDPTKNANGEEEFSCDICDYKTCTRKRLQLHVRKHSVIKKNHIGEEDFRCDICDYRTNHKIDLKAHEKVHAGENNFYCSVCEYTTHNRRNLKLHVKSHSGEKDFCCSVCDYKTNVKCNFKVHLKMHTGEKELRCGICDYKTHRKVSLKTHERVHAGETDFCCTICDYRTGFKGNLKRHFKLHTGEKDFACSVCDYKTSIKSNLMVHLKVHTGEKDFCCGTCGYRTNHRNHLKTHETVHTGEKNFCCTLCDYRSGSRSNLTRHFKSHTRVKEF